MIHSIIHVIKEHWIAMGVCSFLTGVACSFLFCSIWNCPPMDDDPNGG